MMPLTLAVVGEENIITKSEANRRSELTSKISVLLLEDPLR